MNGNTHVRFGERGGETRWPQGQKVRSAPTLRNWRYRYDALGNLTSQTDARLCTLTLTYDALNRVATKSSGNDTDCVSQVSTTYTYDSGTNGKGHRTGMTSTSNGQNVTNSWSYDTRGRVISETVNAGTAYTTQWDYNVADLPKWMKYPVDAEQVNYEYTDRMLLNKVFSTASTYVSSTTYDPAGRMDFRTFGNGTQTDYAYHPWTQQGGRLQLLQSGTSGNPMGLQNMTYTYDAVGNISQLVNTVASETNTYGYDALNRLTSWTLNGVYEYYTYDPASGNLDVKAGVDLNYNDLSHVHAVTHIGSTQKYWYDQNGNQTTRSVGADTFNLIYDAENRLMEVKKNSVTMATFVYDGDGRRVKSTLNGVTTTFAGNHYEVTGSAVTKYYYAGSQRVAMRANGTVYWLFSDHLGSTSMTIDTNLTVSQIRYKPWGETRYTFTFPSGSLPTPYQFTGQHNDSYIREYAKI